MKPTSLRLMMARQLFVCGAQGSSASSDRGPSRRGAGPLVIRAGRPGGPLSFVPRVWAVATARHLAEGDL
jgi:hypothetical protein